MNDDIDYRLQYKKNISKRYFSISKNEEFQYKKLIKECINGKKLQEKNLKIWGRELKIAKSCDKLAIFDFNCLFQNNLSSSDYKAIAKEFEIIFLSHLKSFNSQNSDEAKRFMLFIDEIYEKKVALIILAQENIDDLYQGEEIKKFNSRVISRLNEIKSDYYYNNSKINKNA